MGKLIGNALPILTVLLAIVALLPWMRPRRPWWLAVAILYLLLDEAVTIEPPHILGTHWNWLGKAASILLALVILALLRPGRDETALRWPAPPGEWWWSVAGILGAVLFAGVVNFAFRDHKSPGAEDFLYQATMPGFAEELSWRCLLFLLVGRAYMHHDGRPNLLAASIVSTLTFGLGHGFSFEAGVVGFAWLPFAYATVVGAWLALIRLRSRSVAASILCHNAANVCGALVSGLS